LNQLKNIIISIVAATQVINGEISLGMMMAITYIIGQVVLETPSNINSNGNPSNREDIKTTPLIIGLV